MDSDHKKRISVIIPTRNEEKTIALLIENIKSRGGPSIQEIIISDGGSIDGTVETASKNGARVLLSPKKGRANQLNYGAEMATGDILYFLHADTIPPENFGQLIIWEVLKGHLAGSFKRKFDNNGVIYQLSEFIGSLHILNYPYGDQSLFIEKKLFIKIGGYKDMIIMEDHEIIERAVKETSFTILPEKVITSARKFQEQGVIRLHSIFLLITIMYQLGFREKALLGVYRYFIT